MKTLLLARMRHLPWLIVLLILSWQSAKAHATTQSAFEKLPQEQKATWQRLLFQADSFFRPQNADYYLSATTPPDLAEEYGLVRQYLMGERAYAGPPDEAPWCRFPARFFFVAGTTTGKFLAPQALTPCNLALPVADESLEAYLVKELEPEDSGQSLFHIDLLIQGKRFHNGSALTLKLGFGRDGKNVQSPPPLSDVLTLLRSFTGEGRAWVQKDVMVSKPTRKKQFWQSQRISLPPRQIYLLSLLGLEARHAKFPYELLRANCHTYLENLMLSVFPALKPGETRWFFDYFPEFETRLGNSVAAGQASPFVPHRYWASPRQQLEALARELDWNDYRLLQTVVDEGTMPTVPDTALTHPLRLAIGKATELHPKKLAESPELLAFRDEYLALEDQLPQPVSVAPLTTGKEVPPFSSPYPSALGMHLKSHQGKPALQLEMVVFSTRADQLQGTSPYGFTMGKLNLFLSESGLGFDSFVFAEENKVGDACCGALLYPLGIRKLDGHAITIVNAPQASSPVPNNSFKPQLELGVIRGLGTIAKDGPSFQVLPTLTLMTYGRHVDFVIDTRLGWQSGPIAVSATRMAQIYSPTERRAQVRQSLKMEYQLSRQERLEFSHKVFDKSVSQSGIGYVYAF